METIELGGNIGLTGFSDLDFTELIVVKKIVGQYARKLSDTTDRFGRLNIVRKLVHQHDGHGKVEIIVKADVDGHEYAAETVDHNLFVALDLALKRVFEQVQKHVEMQH